MRAPWLRAFLALSLSGPCAAIAAAEAEASETEPSSAEPACPPGSTPSDESPAMRALDPALMSKFLVAGCPPRGCAGDSAGQARLNLRKNRVESPSATEIDSNITLARMVESSADDRERWRPDSGARIAGYVRHVWQGGVESANCRTTDILLRDTHIDVFTTAADSEPSAHRIVVEVTPRIRALAAGRGEDWSTAALKQRLEGHWVEFTGWMFFDSDHCNEESNTIEAAGGDCGGPGNGVWRQSGWEVHPVTSFRVLSGPPRN